MNDYTLVVNPLQFLLSVVILKNQYFARGSNKKRL